MRRMTESAKRIAGSTPPEAKGGKLLRPAAFTASDAALIEACLDGDARAERELYRRHAPHAYRVLLRCLGQADPVPDALQEVFVQVFRSLPKLQNPDAAKAWITRIAVRVARTQIKRQARRRWLSFWPSGILPDTPTSGLDPESSRALEDAYRILERMGADERIAFALRFIEGMELTEVAAAADVSLATIKRRLKRAEGRFLAAARNTPSLEPWLKGGSRWA
jgi:RNA polymerase sigma-70 factor, ECF subfamily